MYIYILYDIGVGVNYYTIRYGDNFIILYTYICMFFYAVKSAIRYDIEL